MFLGSLMSILMLFFAYCQRFLKYLQEIDVCILPNNNTTLALSDIYITFQSCFISFMEYFFYRFFTL